MWFMNKRMNGAEDEPFKQEVHQGHEGKSLGIVSLFTFAYFAPLVFEVLCTE